MTIAPAPSISVITPSGTATGPWNTDWTFVENSDVRVYIETGGEAGSDLVEGVDYTLAAPNPQSAGGAITLFPSAVPVGGWVTSGANATRLIFRRRTARRQATALPDIEGHKPRATEQALDRAMRIAQEITDEQALTVKVPPGATPPSPADLAAAAAAGAKIAEALDKSNEALAGVESKADTDGANISTVRAPTFRGNLHQFWVTPEDFRHEDDAPGDWEPAIRRMLASPLGTKVRWGDGREYVVNDTLLVLFPGTTWEGSATLKLVRDPGAFVVPLLNVAASATGFYCSPTMVFDHNAEDLPPASYANQPAIAWSCCVLLQAPGFVFGCRVKNAWDCGVGVVRFVVTGDGTAGSPFSAAQTNGQPQSWTITTVDGENCGVGDHTGAGFGEVGKKGAVVNILTGSDGVVQSVTGRGNYGGFIADFGGGGEVAVGAMAFTGTKRDLDNPNNGSGIDCYIGTGPVIIGSLKSDNAGRYGLAITHTAGQVQVNARIHAPAEEGAYIRGGNVSGAISVSASSMTGTGLYDAVAVTANEANVALNLLVSAEGTTHRYSYFSEVGNDFQAFGQVELVSKSAAVGPIPLLGPGGNETVKINTRKALAINVLPVERNTLTSIWGGRGMSLEGENSFWMNNCYFDVVDSGWKFLTDGFAGYIKAEEAAGFGLYMSTGASNAAGRGASATMQRYYHFRRNYLDSAVPIRAVAPSGTGPIGDPGFMGTLEAISAGLGGKVAIAFDDADSGGAGVIQSLFPSNTVRPLKLNRDGGAVQLSTGAWDTGPTRMGGYYLWVDGSGRLRIKSGAPASATDGVVVGSQS